jgi:LPS sulfotransferase NodH
VARRWFEQQSLYPLVVSYEQLVADPDGVTRQLLGFLGLDGAAAISTTMQPQADALNTEWIARYHRESAFLPPGLPKLTDPLPRERTRS